MEPMSLRYRMTYLSLCVVLFLIFIPIVVFYSLGYRLTNTWQIEMIGGIHIASVGPSDSVYVDGKLEERTSIFQNGVFVLDLTPKMYHIEVSEASTTVWKKDVLVLPEQVTEAYPFLVLRNPEFLAITPKIPNSAGVSGTPISNPQYAAVSALFKVLPQKQSVVLATSTIQSTTSPESLAVPRQNIKIWKDQNTIYAEWVGDPDDIPFYFCKETETAPLACTSTITVYKDSYIGSVDFYPGRNDVVLFSTQNGLFATELDLRSPQNIDSIIQTPNVDFRVVDNNQLFIKDINGLFKVSLM